MKSNKTVFFVAIAISTSIFGVWKSYQNIRNNRCNGLVMENIEAMSSGESVGTGNTGPAKIYDCPGLFTGDGKMCMCTNSYPYTETQC